jgi:hypothetical protein
MESEVRIERTDDLVEVRVSGTLTRKAYEDFVPLLEEAIQQHGKLRVLFIMDNFHGWTAGGLWEELGYDLKHFRDIRRLGLVGEKAWQHAMTVFCRPFTAAEIKYFPLAELEAAREWLRRPLKSAKRDS